MTVSELMKQERQVQDQLRDEIKRLHEEIEIRANNILEQEKVKQDKLLEEIKRLQGQIEIDEIINK